MPSMMSLPVELALLVVQNLDLCKDIAALGQTCRKHHEICDPILYQTAFNQNRVRLIFWAIDAENPNTLGKALAAGFRANETLCKTIQTTRWREILKRNRLETLKRIDFHTQSAVPGLTVPVETTYAQEIDKELLFLPFSSRPMRRTTPEDPAGLEDCTTRDWYCEENGLEGGAWSQNTAGDTAITCSTIHLAAQKGSTAITEILLNLGVNIDQFSKGCCDCRTPMSLTETLENTSPRHPLDAHADHPIAASPLHLALCHHQHDNAKLLISRGATILYHPVWHLHPMTHSYDPGISFRLFSAFHFAAASGQLGLLQWMVDRIQEQDVPPHHSLLDVIDRQDGNGLTPLYHAMANHHWDTTVPYLVGLGANPNPIVQYALDGAGCDVRVPLLAEFCRVGRFEDASRLLGFFDTLTSESTETHVSDRYQTLYPDQSLRRPQFRIPLLHISCMEPLRDYERNFGPMRDLASEANREKWRSVVLRKLAARGLGPHLNKPWGIGEDPDSTPLMVAARHGNLAAINTLLDLGADARVRNRAGQNLLMVAMIQRARYNIVGERDDPAVPWTVNGPLLPKFDQEFEEMLPLTSSLSRIPLSRLESIIDRLLDARIPINDQDTEGLTALHYFFHGTPLQRFVPTYGTGYMKMVLELCSGEKRLLRFLLDRGADPTINAGTPGKSVLWSTFSGPWSSVCEILQSSRFGPDISRFFNDNPQQLRAMFMQILKQCETGKFCDHNKVIKELQRLIDIDHSRNLKSDKYLLFQVIFPDWGTNLALQQLICRFLGREMDVNSLGLNTPAPVFTRAIELGAWNLASKLVPQIDFTTPGKETVAIISALAKASWIWDSDDNMSWNSKEMSGDTGRWDLIVRAVEAGFNIHWRPPAGVVKIQNQSHLSIVGYEPKSLLSWLISLEWVPLVELLLQRQPVRGNPEAAQSTYLHEALLLPVRFRENHTSLKDDVHSGAASRALDCSLYNRIIYALLAAGADPTVKNERGQLPIDLLLQGLSIRPQCIQNYSQWFDRLMRGLDENDAIRCRKYISVLLERHRPRGPGTSGRIWDN